MGVEPILRPKIVYQGSDIEVRAAPDQGYIESSTSIVESSY